MANENYKNPKLILILLKYHRAYKARIIKLILKQRVKPNWFEKLNLNI